MINSLISEMNYIKFNQQHISPSKIVCVGRNYAEHIKELDNEVPDEPVIFIKPNSAIYNEIVFSKDDTIHYEGEITFLIISGEIAGVGFGLDLTKREVQNRLKEKGLPWERAKAFDKSAVFSEFVEFNSDVNTLRLELYINNKLVQSGGADMMLHKPEALLAEIKNFLTLEDGDLIMSGTPKGVGPIRAGDSFLGKIYAGERLLVEDSWVVK